MLAGQTLGGRYDVLELIASGGMGEVYRARDRELDELVALKVIRSDRADAAMVERFRHEVKLARRVTHANVARTFELGHAGDLIYCTMELVEGETLEQRLARQHRLPVAQAVGIACAVCDALVAAHAANVIHRDIKPANVLIAHDGRVVLADFGIAAARVGETDASGTPAYMAPEQARGEPATAATDVYAVGVVLYEMLSGQRAFHGTVTQIADTKEHVTRLVPTGGDISSELAAVVAHATAASVDERIASAAALRRALAPWATADLHAPAPPPRARPTISEEERTIVLVAPRVTTDKGQIASEIYEQLLAHLAHGTLRVIPRSDENIPCARVVVRFDLDDTEQLHVKISAKDAAPFSLTLPLAIETVPRAVELATAAIQAATAELPALPGAAHELRLRARHIARIGAGATARALELAEQANAQAPGDPKTQAFLAILLTRAAFFGADVSGEMTRRAGELIRAALASANELADVHLAAGHFELHTGDPTIAAGHYRVAIARAPHLAEAHEHLGRVLIEAGYVEAALARFAEAAAIAPQYINVQWEIARAYALDNRWDDYEALVVHLDETRRPVARGRTAWWRNDVATMREARALIGSAFERKLLDKIFDIFLGAPFEPHRDFFITKVFEETSPSRRRKTFISQLVAEAVGHAGDLDLCLRILEHATDQGLFDLQWLDKVPPLRAVRARPEYAAIRGRVEARARAIYDALYGDHGLADSATALATS